MPPSAPSPLVVLAAFALFWGFTVFILVKRVREYRRTVRRIDMGHKIEEMRHAKQQRVAPPAASQVEGHGVDADTTAD